MKKVIGILILLSTYCFAQFTFKGKILHIENNKPVVGAVVFFTEIKKGIATDTNGFFSFKDLQNGEYTLKIMYVGHKPLIQKVRIDKNMYAEFQIENLPESTDEVVITATMKEMNKLESAIPVEIYNPAFFKKNPSPNLFEALSMVNGVQPQLNCNVCNTGDIHINGMEGPYTMLLIDGMPIVSSLSTVYGLMGIPNSMIKRIEVIKGPGATLYGSEAVGGIINIITKDPVQTAKLALDITTGTYLDYNIDVAGKIKKGIATGLVGVNYYNFSKKWDKNNDGFTDVTLQNRISVFNKWNFERKNNRVATIGARLVYEDRWGGQTNWTPAFRGTDSIYGESIYTKRLELIGVYQLPIDVQKLTLQYSYNVHNQNSYYGTSPYFATQHVAFAQLLWDKKIGLRNDFLIGLPFRYTFYDDNTVGTQTDLGINKPQNTFLPGLFLQDEYKLNEKFTILGGARYDYNNYHGNIFSGRLALKFAPNKKNTFRISTGNGFRVVNLFTEDHAALTGARQVVIVNKLNPETSWNINANYSRFIYHKFGYVGIDASVFYTRFGNKIVGDFLTDPNKIIYDNIKGYAISQGITANLDFSFTNGLKIILGVTYMDVYQIENQLKIPQIHAPNFSGTYQISYSFEKIKLSIDYTGRVYGPMYLPVVPNDFRPEQSPWFDLANIQLTKKLPYQIEIYGGLKNIWNFMPQNPILRPFDPFDKNISVNNPNGYTFDPNYNYAPLQTIRGFLGVRWKID
ncbi:MAG: TonB-dependent receptor [Bacteroidetes bacterium]|nr:MAG: TonB-dependent receptor [Bacteroidota bacterium]